MATRAERRVSGVSERRRYYRGGRRLDDRPYDADARVNDFASELAKTAGFQSYSSIEWADGLTQDVEAVLSALNRLWPSKPLGVTVSMPPAGRPDLARLAVTRRDAMATHSLRRRGHIRNL